MKLKFFIMFLLTIFIIGSVNSVYSQEFDNEQISIEIVAENLEIPWAIAFDPDGRIFVTERVGKLRVIEDGKLNPEPVIVLNVGIGEAGLLGLALDPNFEENHYVYLYYTYSEFFTIYNKVVRYTEKNNSLSDEKILLDKIPGAFNHDGGRMKFGPDKKLYITTGDAGNANSAQDLNSLAGKILRINSDGTIPDDNPFGNSLVYSYGHRNPQGLDWDPVTGKLVVTEHGPSAHDEVNVVEAGKNYGWPIVIGGEHDPKYVDSIIHSGDDTWAPSGGSFYNSGNIPDWTNKFFIATLRGSHLRMLDLDLEKNKVISSEALFQNSFGRLRDASMGPDGNLYLLTSNRDGRGSPEENDDRILKIIKTPFLDDKAVLAPKNTTIDPGFVIPYEEGEELIDYRSLSPKKQLEIGFSPDDVVCKKDLEKIFKSTNGLPACVNPDTAKQLVLRGWGIMEKNP